MHSATKKLYESLKDPAVLARATDKEFLTASINSPFNISFLHHDLPSVIRDMHIHKLSWFENLMSKKTVGGYYSRVQLSRLQYGMLRLQKEKDARAFAISQFPFVAVMEQLPAFGWDFYDYLLNFSYFRDLNYLDLNGNYFDTQDNRLDAIFRTPVKWSNYTERLALSLPNKHPKTWAQELRALNQMLDEAREKFEACKARGIEFHKNAGKKFYLGSIDSFRNAKFLVNPA